VARSAPWYTASLLPKLFGAFVAVLALASLTTLLIETNLTRSELSAQTEDLTQEQATAYRNQLRAEENGTTRGLRIFVQQVSIDTPDSARALLDSVSVARLAGKFTLAEAFDVTTGEYRLDPPRRERVIPPDPETTAIGSVLHRQGQRRVVPLRDAAGDSVGFGMVYTLPFSDLDERVLLAVGSPLDSAYARDVRSLVGAEDVELVVDGRVVASTVDGATADPSGDPLDTEVQATAADRLVQYLPVAVDDGWSRNAYVGLLLDDPLGPLDARLARYRTLMVALLLVIGGVLSLAFATVMTRPLSRLTRTARAIAGGDLDASFDVSRRDEIGQLAEALERMRRALRAQLQVIGQQADALQLAARRVVGSRDRERQRLAQDLHDGIQQQLVVLRMQVGAARSRLRRDPDAVDEVASGLATSIDQLLDDLRRTAQALYPSILRDRGLAGALHSLAARAELPVDLTLDPDPLPRVDEDVEANAYFLVSEAVTNALKHANASRITVGIRLERDALRVEIRDDGRGFDPAAVHHSGGLQHLRDRVNALGGTLQLVTAPEEGTRVTALLPAARGGSLGVATALEVEQDGGDPTVEVELLGEAELPEDGVGVLLDRPVRDRQLPGDGGVPLA
jgi:signal transduction histidine kinase